MKIALPLLFLVYVFLLVFFPAIRLYRKTGIWPIRTKNEKALHEFTAGLVKVMFGFLFVSVAVYCFAGDYYEWLKPVHRLYLLPVKIAGEVLLIASLLWMMIAQLDMGDSWRVGIDDENKTQLVTKGLYRFSRNPIYVGLVTGLLGFFLLLPDMLTFATLMSAYFVISIQIRIEEDFLLQQHGESFNRYLQQVRRWL